MEKMYETRDKHLIPFLLTQKETVKLVGTKVVGTTVYFQFAPFDMCEELVKQYMTFNAPLVQPKILMEAVETFRDMIFQERDKNV